MSTALGPPASRRHRAWHHRGYLPHFDSGAVVQAITFRLADSLPRDVYKKELATIRDDLVRRKKLDAMIDEGRGLCLLRRPEYAEIVQRALEHFDGDRYRLIAWVIMPNHVHVLIEQIVGFRLAEIVGSWKSFTAKEINKRRKMSGTVWSREYFDRFIRDEKHFNNATSYVENNPVKAGLVKCPEAWQYSSATRRHAGGTPAVPGDT